MKTKPLVLKDFSTGKPLYLCLTCWGYFLIKTPGSHICIDKDGTPLGEVERFAK